MVPTPTVSGFAFTTTGALDGRLRLIVKLALFVPLSPSNHAHVSRLPYCTQKPKARTSPPVLNAHSSSPVGLSAYTL